jgi:hypothetical protein
MTKKEFWAIIKEAEREVKKWPPWKFGAIVPKVKQPK